MLLNFLVIVVIIVILLVIISKIGIKMIIVYDWEKGLKFKNGKFSKILDSGSYWYSKFTTSIQKIDTRPKFISIPGQEVLSSDSVSIKVSILTQYQVSDAYAAVTKTNNYEESLYTALQISLREIVGNSPVDDLLEKRNELRKKLFESTDKKAEEFGLKLISADIKDIMFPGELKKMFAQITKAKKEGLAALERARGETAALRNLSNAAKMLDDNPNLFQLRMLQALSDTSGNTFVMSLGNGSQIYPVKGQKVSLDKTEEKETKE